MFSLLHLFVVSFLRCYPELLNSNKSRILRLRVKMWQQKGNVKKISKTSHFHVRLRTSILSQSRSWDCNLSVNLSRYFSLFFNSNKCLILSLVSLLSGTSTSQTIFSTFSIWVVCISGGPAKKPLKNRFVDIIWSIINNIVECETKERFEIIKNKYQEFLHSGISDKIVSECLESSSRLEVRNADSSYSSSMILLRVVVLSSTSSFFCSSPDSITLISISSSPKSISPERFTFLYYISYTKNFVFVNQPINPLLTDTFNNTRRFSMGIREVGALWGSTSHEDVMNFLSSLPRQTEKVH